MYYGLLLILEFYRWLLSLAMAKGWMGYVLPPVEG